MHAEHFTLFHAAPGIRETVVVTRGKGGEDGFTDLVWEDEDISFQLVVFSPPLGSMKWGQSEGQEESWGWAD